MFSNTIPKNKFYIVNKNIFKFCYHSFSVLCNFARFFIIITSKKIKLG
ncbi:MAG: hypothetical protein RL757_2413 [Bacteroidota bacterium]|jgi:hypothetical protein